MPHTPGPWHESLTHLGAAFDIGAADGDNIALVIGPVGNGSDNFRANARLIAAAPALLTAVLAAVDVLHSLPWDSGNSAITRAQDACVDAINQARDGSAP